MWSSNGSCNGGGRQQALRGAPDAVASGATRAVGMPSKPRALAAALVLRAGGTGAPRPALRGLAGGFLIALLYLAFKLFGALETLTP